eukprot:CCRYP_007702-RE/>CCRYP_007702-RE protein AED:0.04 eAED:0.04 QI:3750/1/1/1/0.71/0.62/8/190/1362
MKESIKRRRESPFIDISNHVKELKGQWKLGVYWPSVREKKFMRVLRDRPALMSIRGEVFWRNLENPCKDVDFVWDRNTENSSDECFTIHYLQGVSGAYLREFPVLEDGELGSRATTDIYEGRVTHPYRPPQNDMHYDKFCSFLIRSDPNGLVQMFKDKYYDIDAIVRHMFFKQLGEYKACERITGCPGNPYTSYKCFVGKFHITMENSAVDGYISEKLFNGALGTGIPIYFGASDVGSYINPKSVVLCNVSRSVIEEMRAFYPRAPQKSRTFLFNRTSFWPTEQELLKWADRYLRRHLEPCVKKVIELDANDSAFREVLNEPFITNPDIMSGLYPLRGIELAYDTLRNWSLISSSDESVTTGIRRSASGTSISSFKVIELWTYPVQPFGVKPNLRHSYICSYHSCRTTMFEMGIVSQPLNLKSLMSHSNVPSSYRNFIGDQHWFKILHQYEFPHHVQLVSIMLLLLEHESKGGGAWDKVGSRAIAEPPLCVMTVGLDSSEICSDSSEFVSLKKKYDPTAPINEDLVFQFIPLNIPFQEHFGILGFDNWVSSTGKANSGDELQTFAGLQFLPYLSDYIDRERGLPIANQVNLFGNGWWGTRVAFPPHESSNMILVSMHMSSFFLQVASDNLEYFKSYTHDIGPIGARDIPSYEFLKGKGVPVFVSSCFSQMISMYEHEKKKRTGIVIVDVEVEHLPKTIRLVAKNYSSYVPEDKMMSRFERLKHAYNLLRIYATETKVLITSQIHAALPASALGIPVIFVENTGGGDLTEGISDLFHVYNVNNVNASWPYGNLNDIGSNPQVHQQDRYRASFWHYIKARADRKHHYEDTARLFGLVPLTRLGKGTESMHLHSLFHFIFTTPPKTLTVRVQRAIEAVFFHHPNAKVMLHSNTLSDGTILDCFWEAGYDFGIYNYSFINLLQSSSAIKTTEVNDIAMLLPNLRKEQYWYSHETDFIRLLLLERYGGVYLDTDMHVLRPFNSTITNLVAWQDSNHRLINGAAMVFEKGNKFLQSCLRKGVSTLLAGYEPQLWSTYGPNLLTSTYREWFKVYKNNMTMTAIVDVAENDVFYPYPYEIVHECFQCNNESKSPINPTRTLAVHLNTKATAGSAVEQNSVCSRILTESCIFCDDPINFSNCTFHNSYDAAKQAVKAIETSHFSKMNRYPDEFTAVQKFLKNMSTVANRKILSFGSSTGEEAISLATLYLNEKEGFPNATIYGFDLDNPTLYKARQKVAKYFEHLPIHFFNGQQTPLDVNGKYDAIFANSVFCHHNPDAGPITVETIKSRFTFQDFEAALLKLDAVLNDGGVLAMMNTNYYFVDTILAQRYELLAQCAGDSVPKVDIKKHVLVENNETTKPIAFGEKERME